MRVLDAFERFAAFALKHDLCAGEMRRRRASLNSPSPSVCCVQGAEPLRRGDRVAFSESPCAHARPMGQLYGDIRPIERDRIRPTVTVTAGRHQIPCPLCSSSGVGASAIAPAQKDRCSGIVSTQLQVRLASSDQSLCRYPGQRSAVPTSLPASLSSRTVVAARAIGSMSVTAPIIFIEASSTLAPA